MFKVAKVFSNNMVLQRQKNVKIFGTGDEGTVTVKFNNITAKAKISDGKWTAVLPPMEACDNLSMTVSDGKTEVVFTNVCIGEVWLAGGQSNMELELQNAKDGAEYLSKMTADMPVRFYYTNKAKTVEEAEKMEENSGWGLCDKEGSRAWSAVGYHFATKLAKELGVTVGIIGCNWGGTSASAWVSKETLQADKDLNTYLEEYDEKTAGKTHEQLCKEYLEYEIRNNDWEARKNKLYAENPDISWDEVQEICGVCEWPGPMAPNNPFRPNGLYQTMINRVCPYTLRGFTYYQGESDDHKPDMYYKLLTALITNWRNDWGDDELSFEIVQLPMFKFALDPDYKHWCKIRDAQMKAFKTVKNTGIAVISDCGEFNNIHPLDKLPVGQRLALQALDNTYAMKVSAFGPLFKSAYFEDDKITLSFDHAENGFEIKGELNGFEVWNANGEISPAKAEISGENIILTGDFSDVAFVSYDYYNWIEPAVFGKETKIPLAPFKAPKI